MRTVPCLLLLVVACADESPFVPLDELCTQIAEASCEARTRCCESSVAAAACERDLGANCDAQVKAIEMRESVYDGERAHRLLQGAREAFDRCESDLLLAAFFEGGKAVGDTCAAHTECASLSCDPSGMRCVAPASSPVCGPS